MASILKQKYPAKSHIIRVVDELKASSSSSDFTTSSVIFIEGTKGRAWPDSDMEVPFRQSRYFYYVTGCNQPDCSYSFDVLSGKSTLYIPPQPEERVMVFNGPNMTPEEAKKMYDIDDVQYSTSIASHLYKMTTSSRTQKAIMTIDKLENPIALGVAQPATPSLKTAIEKCRIVKDAYEIELVREANRISTLAHIALMRATRTAKSERQLKAIFVGECIAEGADGDGQSDGQAYGAIIAAGTAGATLHYMKDNQVIDSSMLNMLVDASGEFKNYASDITRTFPINGTFDKASRAIYQIVLKMQMEVIERLKIGADWGLLNRLAHEILIDGLKGLGLLEGSKQDIMNARVSYLFLPHGIGHYIGLETHDVRSPSSAFTTSTTSSSPPFPSSKQKREHHVVRRDGATMLTSDGLPEGSIITVEPGIYFNKRLIEPAFSNPKFKDFLNKEVIEKYWKTGGFRIEDCILITKDGYENLTTAPKGLEEIEAIVSGKEEPEWEMISKAGIYT